MKKETLEEAAREYYKRGQFGFEKAADTEMAFLKGAKWQQETMYSEKEVESLLHKFMQHKHPDWHGWSTTKWFEQNKKK